MNEIAWYKTPTPLYSNEDVYCLKYIHHNMIVFAWVKLKSIVHITINIFIHFIYFII